MPVPTIATNSRGFKLFGEYKVKPQVIFRLVYDFEHLNTEDPALNTGPLPNTAATSLAGVVGAPS
jgi:hypothetical protein